MKMIEVISIPVSNQQRSKAFYLDLGFQLIAEAPIGNGQTWVQLGLPGQATTVSLTTWWPFTQATMHAGSLHGIFLETDNMEKEVMELKTKGIEAGMLGRNGLEAGKIDNSPWGKFAHVIDPDGNVICLHQNTMRTAGNRRNIQTI